MSQRFKRRKPLSSSAKNTKSGEKESPMLLPAGPESAGGVRDFLYIDRTRISSLYAQLFPQGTLTSVKTTAQQGFTTDNNIGTDIKIFKAEAKETDSGLEGVEHVFDASWSIPLEVLEELIKRALVRATLKARDDKWPNLGDIVLESGYLRLIDYATIKDLWDPAIRLMAGQNEPMQADTIIALLKSLPHTLNVHFLTESGYLWGSLSPGNLNVPSADIALKHGSRVVSGRWQMLFTTDAFPEVEPPPELDDWGAGEATKAILQIMEGLRTALGRPAHWFGVTPLMIFRTTSEATVTENSDES